MFTPTFAKTHNLIAYLAKPTESEGFEQIIDILNGSSHYGINNHLSCYKSEVQLLKLGDMSHHKDIYDNPSLTKKVFANMKRIGTGFSGIVTLLFDNMLPSPSNDLLPGGKDSLKLKELMDLCTHLSNKVLELESKVIDIKSTYKERIEKLEGRVDVLE
uniref:Uncharacterized protein n=1 Tax=Tanacetum cinerariifolium TaxID=118510 RepID=A0A699HZV8_TANCI|nr:hypothetical protein [Tanacetum cinerariifolium]